MSQEILPEISMEEILRLESLSDEERWAERMKPSRQRNLTPQQRQRLARQLRAGRRAHFLEVRLGLTESHEDRTGRSVGSPFSDL